MTTVFVYGTLKRGHGNNYLMGSPVFLGEGKLVDQMRMKQVGFPAVFEDNDPNHGSVLGNPKGEVFQIDDEALKKLDRLEGNGVMYNREVRTVAVQDKTIEAWVYLAHGDFKARISNYEDIIPNDQGELIWGYGA